LLNTDKNMIDTQNDKRNERLFKRIVYETVLKTIFF